MDPNRPAPPGSTPDGDAESIARVIDSYRNYLLFVANRIRDGRAQTREGASDLVQEAMLAAVATIRAGRPPQRTAKDMKAWLRRILLNTHDDLVRRERAQKRDVGREVADAAVDLAADSSSPSEKAVKHEESARLDRALSRLDAVERQILIWRHDEGLIFEEIADRLGITASGARKAYLRAAGQFRSLVEPGSSPAG